MKDAKERAKELAVDAHCRYCHHRNDPRLKCDRDIELNAEDIFATLLAFRKEGRLENPVINAAVELCTFARTHEFPKKGTDEFFKVTELIDKLDTALRAEGLISQSTQRLEE